MKRMNKMQDNPVWKRNIETFSKHYPEYAEKVKNKEYDRNDGIMVDIEVSYSGETILTITKENKKYYLAGKYAPELPLLDWSLTKEKINKSF